MPLKLVVSPFGAFTRIGDMLLARITTHQQTLPVVVVIRPPFLVGCVRDSTVNYQCQTETHTSFKKPLYANLTSLQISDGSLSAASSSMSTQNNRWSTTLSSSWSTPCVVLVVVVLVVCTLVSIAVVSIVWFPNLLLLLLLVAILLLLLPATAPTRDYRNKMDPTK